MDKPGVIILGGHVQALGIVRAYGRMGLQTVIIDKTARNISRHSKYCTEYYVVNDENLFQFLIDLGKGSKYHNWIVFPSNDFHVKILSQNKKKLEEYFKITTDQWSVIKLFYNKKEAYNLAQQLEIPIANTFFPKNENDLQHIYPVYPCIIKPAVMHDFYRQVKKKVFVCNNFAELKQNYKRACTLIPADEIIVQDIVKGASRNQFSACFLFLDGKSYVSLTATRMRQHPLDFGNATTYAETVDVPLLKEYAEKILKFADYNGLCEVEFKKDQTDGMYKFLEVNTRTWKWHAIAEMAGTPFLENYFHYLTGKTIEPMNTQQKASFRHGLTDLLIQLQLMLNGYSYAFRKLRPTVNAVFDYYDMKPWIYEKIYLAYLIRNR